MKKIFLKQWKFWAGMGVGLAAGTILLICSIVSFGNKLDIKDRAIRSLRKDIYREKVLKNMRYPDAIIVLDRGDWARIHNIMLGAYKKKGLSFYPHKNGIITSRLSGISLEKVSLGAFMSMGFHNYVINEAINGLDSFLDDLNEMHHIKLIQEVVRKEAHNYEHIKLIREVIHEKDFKNIHIVPNLIRYLRSYDKYIVFNACKALIFLEEYPQEMIDKLKEFANMPKRKVISGRNDKETMIPPWEALEAIKFLTIIEKKKKEQK